MQLIPLGSEAIINKGFSHKIILDYADVAAGGAATTTTKQIFPEGTGTFAAGLAVLRCAAKLVTAFDFSDAGITSLTLEVGDGTDPNRFLDSMELAVDGTEVLYKIGAVATSPYAYLVADGIDALFTVANGGSPLVNECTSGKVEIYLLLSDLSDMTKPQ